jgi:glycosyltransferase involved in cell wall biosynthesis
MPFLSAHFLCLYAAREKHPATRVDLTELFSAGLVGRGHAIDWHMQGAGAQAGGWIQLSAKERVCVGTGYGGRSVLTQVRNLLAGLEHDLRLYRIAGTRDYDFVQVRDKIFAGLIGLLAAKTRGLPFYYWMSFPYPEADRYRADDPYMRISFALRSFYRLRGAWTDWLLYRVLLPRASHVFVQSDRMKDMVAARGIPADKMTAVPMGINLDQVAERGEPNASGGQRLVYVGSMVRLRRMEFLLETLKRVHAEFPHAELLMVGEGLPRDMAFLREEAARLGVRDRVHFTGALPMERAWDEIRGADICLSPLAPNPILEVGTPTKVIEYMAFNKVVVANNHPDQTKLLEESGAGLAVEYEPQAFADAIVRLLRDPEGAAAMGARGRDYVSRNRSYAALSAALESRYLQLLGRSAAVRLAEATSL